MTDTMPSALLIAAAVGSGLVGGLFFIFSNTIMKSFDRLPPAGAVAAMNSINATILNPLFFLVFFGTALLCAVLLLIFGSRISESGPAIACGGSLLYLVGSIVVTMAFNVPLNNRLATVRLSASDLAAQWQAYRVPWTQWNSVRTVACLLAAAAFTISLLMF